MERAQEAIKIIAEISDQSDPESEPDPAKPFCMRRGAEVQTEKGSCLFERSEFARDPGWAEHRKLPAAQWTDADTRVAFSLLTFSW